MLLFALRYEGQAGADQLVANLKSELTGKYNIDADQVQLVDCLLQYAGGHVRQGDLFGNKSFMASAAKMSKNIFFKGVENVYTQHVSLLKGKIEECAKGKLSDKEYPFTIHGGGLAKDKVDNIVVFIVGGCTLEEARDVHDIKQEMRGQLRVALGGSCVHSSKTFLADVAQLVRSRWAGGAGSSHGGMGGLN